MLSIRDLSKTYANGVRALAGVTLEVTDPDATDVSSMASVPDASLVKSTLPSSPAE